MPRMQEIFLIYSFLGNYLNFIQNGAKSIDYFKSCRKFFEFQSVLFIYFQIFEINWLEEIDIKHKVCSEN